MDDASHPSYRAQKSLSSLSRTARRFHQVVEPKLYSGFVQVEKAGEQTPYQLITFMRTILKRPDLAQRVRTFESTVMTKAVSPRADFEDIQPLVLFDPLYTAQDFETLRARVTSISGHGVDNDEEAASWFEDTKKGFWDAITALVLSQLQNLEEFSLGGWNCDFGLPHLERLLTRAAVPGIRPPGTPLTLTRLQCVTLLNPIDRYGMDFGLLLPILELETLTTFSAYSLNVSELWVTEENDPWSKDAFKNGNILSLALHDSSIDENCMLQFLSCFTNLQQLFIEFSPEGMDYAVYEPPRYLATIQHLKSCLREFTLYCKGTSSDTG